MPTRQKEGQRAIDHPLPLACGLTVATAAGASAAAITAAFLGLLVLGPRHTRLSLLSGGLLLRAQAFTVSAFEHNPLAVAPISLRKVPCRLLKFSAGLIQLLHHAIHLAKLLDHRLGHFALKRTTLLVFGKAEHVSHLTQAEAQRARSSDQGEPIQVMRPVQPISRGRAFWRWQKSLRLIEADGTRRNIRSASQFTYRHRLHEHSPATMVNLPVDGMSIGIGGCV
jgi:hypothetical protein